MIGYRGPVRRQDVAARAFSRWRIVIVITLIVIFGVDAVHIEVEIVLNLLISDAAQYKAEQFVDVHNAASNLVFEPICRGYHGN
jgi:hypothetical protein